LRLGLVGAAFLVSGASALAYQVIWQRILTLHTGVGVTSVAVIVAAFMAGLGLGSHAGGRWSTRVSPRTALWLFAAVELAIGLFALVSCRVYYSGLEGVLGGLWRSTAGTAIAHFLALLLPTSLMGMSLPLLVRAEVRTAEGAARTIARLYGLNVLGAATGALLTPWVLVRYFGLEGAAAWAGAGNLAAGTVAVLAGWWFPAPAGAPPPSAGRPGPLGGTPPSPSGSRLGLWAALYGLSGFCALSLEILWFRIVDVATKSTAFTFGTVLSIYLLGLGAGGLVGARLSSRIRRPLAFFTAMQCLLLAWSAAALAALVHLPPTWPGFGWLVAYWRSAAFFQLGADWDPGGVLRLYVLLPLFLYGPPTVLMGLSFAALQRAVQDDPVTSGRKVGLLQAANIAGCVAGSVLTGLLFLDHLGTPGTARLLLGAGVLFLLVRGVREGWRAPVFAWAALLLAAGACLPDGAAFWRRLHGLTEPGATAFIGEDATAVSAITPEVTPGHWRVSVNGLPHSWVPYEGIHTLLGAVPAMVHPAPAEVAVVGLGSGETAWAVSSRPETRSVTVFEIAASQVDLLRQLAGVDRAPELRRLLEDPRLRVVAADGRHALKRDLRRYDLIQIDALYRTSAGSGNLYSVEFFRLCASRLKPGGVLCSQAPTRRVALTFQAALPHSLDFGNVVVGSNEPLPVDVAAWTARLHDPAVAGRFTDEVREGIAARLAAVRPPWGNPNSRRGLNLDLFPRDELSTPVGR
jgi:predicted membrane-bound spermidine synthase